MKHKHLIDDDKYEKLFDDIYEIHMSVSESEYDEMLKEFKKKYSKNILICIITFITSGYQAISLNGKYFEIVQGSQTRIQILNLLTTLLSPIRNHAILKTAPFRFNKAIIK